MKQTIEIEVPEGKEAIWKDGRVFFIDKQPELPKTWKEFCKNYPIKKEECYINNCSAIQFTGCKCRLPYSDINLLPSFDAAKAHLALIKLHQLRDCYRQGWVPDLKLEKPDKFCIIKNSDFFTIYQYSFRSCFLSFQTLELAQQFLNNFRDLIEEAGDLI